MLTIAAVFTKQSRLAVLILALGAELAPAPGAAQEYRVIFESLGS